MPYDSRDPPPQDEVIKLVDYADEKGLELLLGCDANSHHTGWGSTNINPRGESLHEFITHTNLCILNRGTEPTFLDSRRQEVIDITICSEGMASLVRDWRVSNEPSGSDHRQIRYTLCHTQELKWGRNPKHTNWDCYRLDLETKLKSTPTRFHTRENLEQAAQHISDAIVDSYEENCPIKIKHTSTKVLWWNKELSKLRSEVRRLFNRARKTSLQPDWETFRNSQQKYRKAVVAARRKGWRDFCESIESTSEASRLNKILSRNNSSHMGCLKQPNGEYTESTQDSLKHLMETHFPGFREDSVQTSTQVRIQPRAAYKPRDWSLAAKVVVPSGVEWAIKSFDSYKTPGPDGIYPVFLKEGLDVLLGHLTKVLRASIAHRYVPQAWRDTRVVFIPKPGKNGHILAKDFRPISLSSFMLKTLERLVDDFLKKGPLVTYPLASSQYAYREGRSTETALHHLVGNVEAQLAAKGYALGVFLDIEGAFDSTSNISIKEAMTRHGAPEALVDWTQHMLTGRSLTVSHGDITLRGRPARGCPQGGVLSPLLWCLVVDELLVKLRDAGFATYGYADDVAIVVRGSFLNVLRDLMNEALKITQNWCMAKGLMVNPSKTNAMIFTRKYKPETIELLKLWGEEISFTSTVKYLGVYLDPKLNWKQHLEEKRKKFYTSMWACRRAMGKTWGIKPSIALWLYKAVLLPRLTYAAVVWWPRVEMGGTKTLLKSLQGSYLRAAVGVMRTTPTEALEVALCLPPLDRAVVRSARITAYRLKCQGEWRNTGQGHTRHRFLQKHPFTLKQDRIPRKHQEVRAFKVHIPSREDWRNQKSLSNPNVDLWFTDGSGNNARYGAGFYGPRTNQRETIPLGDLATVFQAEALAILKCAEHLISENTERRNIHICSDSRAAISALAKPTTESSVVWDCMQTLKRLGELNKVTLVWVPGHQGIAGNEEADRLAREGTETDPPNRAVGVPFIVAKGLINGYTEREHLAGWLAGRGCRQSKLLMKKPLLSRANELLAMNREKLSTSIGLLTGHAKLRAHLYNLRITELEECRLCGGEKEDSIHILCYCPVLAYKRYKLLGHMFLEPKDLEEERVNTLLSLVKDTGLTG